MKTIDEVKTPVSLQYEMEVEDNKYVGKSVERRTDTSTTTEYSTLMTHEVLI